MTERYRAAAIQMTVEAVTDPARRDEIIAENCHRAMTLIERLAKSEGDPLRLVVLPACFLQAPLPDRTPDALKRVAITLPGPELVPLVDLCRQYGLYLAGSCVERFPALPGWYFHSGFLVGPGGLQIRSPKVQARSVPHVVVVKDRLEEYLAVVGPDALFPVVDTPIGRLGVLVESEIYVPEVGRALSAKGAEILLHPTLNRPRTPPRPIDAARRARAFENRCFVLSANHAATEGSDPVTGSRWRIGSAGGSAITAPDGHDRAVLANADEGAAVATIDLGESRDRTNDESAFTPLLYRGVYC
ncbi:MAG: nitrilase-related carbon-nitrogen hydrolase [Dehalococcoidia bacterium]